MKSHLVHRRFYRAAMLVLGLLPLWAPPPGRAQSDRNPSGEHRVTAEQLLKALRERRPANEVVPPQSATEPGSALPPLFPEGTAVVERTGSISRHEGWWVFAPEDNQPTVRLLPNLALEAMVRTSEASQRPVRFSVSGELTVFDDANYLLVRSAPRAESPAAETRIGVATGDRREEPQRGRSAAASDDEASDVLAVLRAQGRERPVVADRGPEPDQPGDLGSSALAGVLDGTALIDRPGRVVRRGAWWTLVFESDRMVHPEPPLRLLPCAQTEMMVRVTAALTGGFVYAVSGEVTSFEGTNYLLPRVVTRRFTAGNFSK